MLPAAVLNHIGADAATLRVLLWLASDPTLAKKTAQLAKLADCDTKTVRAAIEYWSCAGILSDVKREESDPAKAGESVPAVSIAEPNGCR